jgi:hypothetical protein
MTSRTIINNEFAQLYFHTDTGIIHHHFTNLLDTEHLREVLYSGLDLLTKHGTCKWLSDNRFMNPHAEEDAEWITNDWLPKVLAAGWKYWALVVPVSWHAKVNMVDYVNTFHEMGVRVMVFSDPDEAMAWLIDIDQNSKA